MTDQAAVQAAFSLSRRAKFVYVSTNGADGYPRTRVMFNLPRVRARAVARGPAYLAPGFGSFLGTNTSSNKVADIRRDARVCLYFSDNRQFEGLTLTGRVEEVDDNAVKGALWAKNWEMYYRGGLNGGDFTVLRFLPQRGLYYHGMRVVEFDASMPVADTKKADVTHREH